jgi:hypothetical protein
MRALLLLLLAAGCGDDGGVDSGLPDAGFDAGFDAASPSTCAAEVMSWVRFLGSEGVPLGIDVPPAAPLDGTVTEVASERLVVSTASGERVFLWQGRPLGELFEDGGEVTLQTDGRFHLVRDAEDVAAVYVQRAEAAEETIATVPGGGPQLALGDLCDLMEPAGGCDLPGELIDVSELEATLGADAEAIAPGTDATIGAWRVRNVDAVQYPGYMTPTCIVEPVFVWLATASGPATP